MTLLMAVAMPPPTTGQATANVAMYKSFEARLPGIKLADTSPGKLKRGIGYHLKRMLGVVRACMAIVRHVVPLYRERHFYTVYESGFGVIYNYILVSLARIAGYNIMIHHHTSAHSQSHRHEFALLANIAGRQAKHIVLGEAMRDDLFRLYPAVNNIVVLNNAIHVTAPESTDPSATVRDRCVRIGLLSNLFFEKGLDVVIDSVWQAIQAGGDITLVLAGPVVGQQASDCIREAQTRFGDRLKNLGPVSGSGKDEFFRGIDIFFFPSRYKYEAQPLVVLEAMSYGLPSVVTDRGYMKELVADCGVVIDLEASPVERAAEALLDLAQNSVSRAAIGERARRRFWEMREESHDRLETFIRSIDGIPEMTRQEASCSRMSYRE